MADRLPRDLNPATHGDAPEQQLQLLTNVVQHLAAQVESPSLATVSTTTTYSANPKAEFDRVAGGRHEHDARPTYNNDNPLEYIDPMEWTHDAS
jgi:hypothetical protein